MGALQRVAARRRIAETARTGIKKVTLRRAALRTGHAAPTVPTRCGAAARGHLTDGTYSVMRLDWLANSHPLKLE